mgnify:CR=1 FL=1
MYLNRYETSNSTNICLDYFSPLSRDKQYARWALTHTFLPFLLVYLHQLSPPHSMLLVYLFESVEIGFATCVLNLSAFEEIPDIVLMDPLYGALGIWVGYLCTRSRRIAPTPINYLSLLVTMAPTSVLWILEDDVLAQLVFGVLCTVVMSWTDYARHGRATWSPPVYLGVTTLVVALVPVNPLYTTMAMTALASILFAAETPRYAPLADTANKAARC